MAEGACLTVVYAFAVAEGAFLHCGDGLGGEVQFASAGAIAIFAAALTIYMDVATAFILYYCFALSVLAGVVHSLVLMGKYLKGCHGKQQHNKQIFHNRMGFNG